jgi:hypothetical protein
VSEEGAALRGLPSKLRAGRVNEQRPYDRTADGEAEEKVPGVKPLHLQPTAKRATTERQRHVEAMARLGSET